MREYVTSQLVNSFFRAGQPLRAYKRNIILGWDETLSNVYFIEKGLIKAYSIGKDGEEFLHLIYGPGEIFPLPWAYTGIQREDYYEAMVDSLLFQVTIQRFEDFSRSNIFVSDALARLLAEQLNSYSDKVDNLEYKKPEQRLAYRLLFLASRFGHEESNQIVIEGPFTHQLIADSIHLARETVSREIHRMTYEGLVGQHGHRIVIKNLPGLKDKLGKDVNAHGWNFD